jgi:hypothetical protein
MNAADFSGRLVLERLIGGALRDEADVIVFNTCVAAERR